MANIPVSTAIDNLLKSTPSTTITTVAALTALGAATTGNASIVAADLAPNAVTADKILAGAVTFAKTTGVQASLVSGTNIRTVNGSTLLGSTDLVISGGTPAADSITTAMLQSGAVTTAKILDANVTLAKITGLGTAATTDTSTIGGANKVPMLDANGNLTTGPFTNDGVALNPNGNIYIPNMRGIRFMDPSGGISADVYHWYNHDANGGELIMNLGWRSAMIQSGPFQFGDNSANRNAQCLHMVSGASSAADTIKPSKAISWQTKRYNGGGTEKVGYITAQASSLSSTTDETVLRFAIAENPASGPVDGFNGGGGTYTKGLSLGVDMAEFSSSGIWHTGSAPAFSILTDGATVTQTCSKYRTVQNAIVTLGGNRTLVISGALSGMRGSILVSQDGTGNRTLALPANAKAVSSFALTTTPSVTDRLDWVYDGTYFYMSLAATGLQAALDADASAYIARAAITDATQKSAVNDLVVNLKAASLWTKGRAIYPFVGGSDTAHSKNLKADAYNITWSGAGVTHNANGITGNASTAYGTTGFDFATDGHATEASIYVYCRTSAATNNCDWIGAINSGSSNRAGLGNTGNSVALLGISSNGLGSSTIAVSSNFSRHVAGNRSGASAQELYADATQATNTEAFTSRCNNDIFLLARNANGAADKFTNSNLAFAWIGDSLTSGEWSTFRGIIDTFQAALSRTKP